MTARRRLAVAASALALVPVLVGCGGNDYNAYCDKVKAHQAGLTDTLGQGGDGALIDALPALEDLRDSSPDDIRADWNQLVAAISHLKSALDAAGIKPSDYHAGRPPKGLTADQRARITAAADEIADAQQAAVDVQQQARDVCHTPLSL
ncbi:hypothetical protein [Nocardioides sp. KR10-350]|uniref:hypothetical protein n=1 Tax=Nocardioides cheoyonin TaxID=3156615 RepID=UPI0032B36750